MDITHIIVAIPIGIVLIAYALVVLYVVLSAIMVVIILFTVFIFVPIANAVSYMWSFIPRAIGDPIATGLAITAYVLGQLASFVAFVLVLHYVKMYM